MQTDANLDFFRLAATQDYSMCFPLSNAISIDMQNCLSEKVKTLPMHESSLLFELSYTQGLQAYVKRRGHLLIHMTYAQNALTVDDASIVSYDVVASPNCIG